MYIYFIQLIYMISDPLHVCDTYQHSESSYLGDDINWDTINIGDELFYDEFREIDGTNNNQNETDWGSRENYLSDGPAE